MAIVHFKRGSLEKFNSIAKDPDTIYFVDGSNSGVGNRIYLGDTPYCTVANFFTNSGEGNDVPVNYKKWDIWFVKDSASETDGAIILKICINDYINQYNDSDWQQLSAETTGDVTQEIIWNSTDPFYRTGISNNAVVTGKPGKISQVIYEDENQNTIIGSNEVFNDIINNTAIGNYSHAEGRRTKAKGICSHSEGCDTSASGNYSHAEGNYTLASNFDSHAEGCQTKATGIHSHAEGHYTNSISACSHAEGYNANAKGSYSHAGGYQTIANDFQFVTGKYNVEKTGCTNISDVSPDNSIFIVGCGTDNTMRDNALRITADGKCMGKSSFVTSGADYAEMFEWIDGNSNNEDRRGLFVTLDGEKIRLANANDDYILGVISATPTIIGDGQTETWKDMYLKDVFGEPLTEIVNIPEATDENGNVIPEHIETHYKINPDYDSTKEYKSRNERKEWATVGFMGKLIVVDDGTCEVNEYCGPGDNGIATHTSEHTNCKVMARIDKNHIKVLLK